MKKILALLLAALILFAASCGGQPTEQPTATGGETENGAPSETTDETGEPTATETAPDETTAGEPSPFPPEGTDEDCLFPAVRMVDSSRGFSMNYGGRGENISDAFIAAYSAGNSPLPADRFINLTPEGSETEVYLQYLTQHLYVFKDGRVLHVSSFVFGIADLMLYDADGDGEEELLLLYGSGSGITRVIPAVYDLTTEELTDLHKSVAMNVRVSLQLDDEGSVCACIRAKSAETLIDGEGTVWSIPAAKIVYEDGAYRCEILTLQTRDARSYGIDTLKDLDEKGYFHAAFSYRRYIDHPAGGWADPAPVTVERAQTMLLYEKIAQLCAAATQIEALPTDLNGSSGVNLNFYIRKNADSRDVWSLGDFYIRRGYNGRTYLVHSYPDGGWDINDPIKETCLLLPDGAYAEIDALLAGKRSASPENPADACVRLNAVPSRVNATLTKLGATEEQGPQIEGYRDWTIDKENLFYCSGVIVCADDLHALFTDGDNAYALGADEGFSLVNTVTFDTDNDGTEEKLISTVCRKNKIRSRIYLYDPDTKALSVFYETESNAASWWLIRETDGKGAQTVSAYLALERGREVLPQGFTVTYDLPLSTAVTLAAKGAPSVIVERPERTLSRIEHIGEVPAEFADVIENNAFAGVRAFGDRLIDTARTVNGGVYTYRLTLKDRYGRELLGVSTETDAYHRLYGYIPTDDGGMLYALGFVNASFGEKGPADAQITSHLLKVDARGETAWDLPLYDVEGEALEYLFEKDGYFYVVGSRDTPETKVRGVGSPDDLFLLKIDENGGIVRQRTIGGSDFDTLRNVFPTDGGFLIYAHIQSRDGDFADLPVEVRGNPLITVGYDLETVAVERGEGEFAHVKRFVGVLTGGRVYADDPVFGDHPNESPVAVIDYGGFYLTVSRHGIGSRPTPVFVSTLWYYYETVYRAFGEDGTLLWQAAVDVTDY